MRFYIITIFYIIWLQISSAFADQDIPNKSVKYNIRSPYSILQHTFSATSNLIKNRIISGHIAYARTILPTQFLFDNKAHSQFIDKACIENNFDKISIASDELKMKAVVAYPTKYNKNDKSKCILFYYPKLISDFINKVNYKLKEYSILAELLKAAPVILYDHPNTGINYDANEGILTDYIPLLKATTESQILDYGKLALKYAAENFDQVCIVGFSLGGCVGTISLDKYLSKNANIDYNKFQLIVVDSFTSIPRMLLPRHTKIADALGWILGVNMNAQDAIKTLICKNIDITVFNHCNDIVVLPEARMYQFTSNYTKENLTSIASKSDANHCKLDIDLTRMLKYFLFKIKNDTSPLWFYTFNS